MAHERTLTDSAFPDDEGKATDLTRRLLAAADGSREPSDYLRAVAQLCADRVLVPVVATATSVATTVDGLTSDREAEMSVVMLQAGDGRRAMVVFTGMDALRAWSPQARPVPVTLDLAARSALADQAVALLVDHSGPHPLVIEGEVLDQLAQGHRLVDLPGGQFGWVVGEGSGHPDGSGGPDGQRDGRE
ncbi:hypothetical protein GCM10009841_18810 [Microlunatus panaciterrae]|uniref:SseB protein N-terminal domain-containing protein n=1 Tax=Microlunatus panaciterrae TaxID=400768 RepID=A0ABS2RN49_9ACTN|nr:SseB family protein [Microlunatus panaciterrae]MBM7800439.1 hypothetical protein [Microlunatus panaciterrae]